MKNPTLEERKAAVDKLLESKVGEFESVIILGKTPEGVYVSMAMIDSDFLASSVEALTETALNIVSEMRSALDTSTPQTRNLIRSSAVTPNEKLIAEIGLMSESELLQFVVNNSEFLSDPYYSDLGNAIISRAEAFSNKHRAGSKALSSTQE